MRCYYRKLYVAIYSPIATTSVCSKTLRALEPNGIFLVSEKIVFEDKVLNKQMIDVYYDFKRAQDTVILR